VCVSRSPMTMRRCGAMIECGGAVESRR
jgi:hypothetical protein